MKSSVDILAGLLALKELEIKTYTEMIVNLQNTVASLTEENNHLYEVLEKQVPQEKHIGFRQGGKDETEERL